MPKRLLTTWYGTFLLGDEGVVLSSLPFPGNAQEIADRLKLIREGEVLDEERSIAPRDAPFSVSEDRLMALEGATKAALDAPPTSMPSPHEMGLDPALLREASLLLATESIKEALPSDQPVVLLLRAMDLVDREGARELEALRYWHSFHFPELGALVDDEDLLDLLAEDPWRETVLSRRPELDTGIDAGRPLDEGEDVAIASMARHIRETRAEARELRTTLEEAMVRAAPNLSVVAGPLVGARLIAHAGSIERLSRMPSSTVQLLGAERALFLHLREGAPAPKHGVVFQHPVVHSSPPWLRGRTSRALAGKIVIAVRADAHGTHPDGDLGRELREQFLARAQQLRSSHPQPPQGWRRRRPVGREGRRRTGGGRRGSRGGPRGGRQRDRRKGRGRKG